MSGHLFIRRQNLLKEKLGEQNLDGMLITNLTNIRYICGFTGSSATCLILPENQYFISDGRYTEQSKKQVSGFSCIIENLSHLELMGAKKRNLIPNGLKLGFEGEHLSVTQYNTMMELFSKQKNYPIEELVEYIDWTPFFHAWEMKGTYPKIIDDVRYGIEARKLIDDGKKLLNNLISDKCLTAKAVIGIFPAYLDISTILLA